MYLEKIPQILPMSVPIIIMIMLISFILILSSNETTWKTEKKIKSMKFNKKEKEFYMSLFLSFDPKTSIMWEMNWIIILLVSTLFISKFWNKPSRNNIFIQNLNDNIGNQFKIALKSEKDGSKGIFVSLFLLILCLNLMGLFPNIFTPTSHISMNMMISFPMWLGFMIFGWTKFTNKMFAHLVPNGTPLPLISFMVLIELISNVIRSLTLSIRLMANMVSGHLLLTLMGNMMENSSYLMIFVLSFIQGILSTLELGVAFIQAYVFCMLLTLYSDESDL